MRYDTLADRAWSRAVFIARPLSRPWAGTLQPVLEISPSRLLVAAGHTLYSYRIQDTLVEAYGTRLVYEGSWYLAKGNSSSECDVTSMAFVDDNEEDRTVCVGFDDGCVEHLRLPLHDSSNLRRRVTVRRAPHAALHSHGRGAIESVSHSRNSLLSLSSWGSVAFNDLSSPSVSPTTLELQARSWTSHLCMTASTPYAAFGTTNTEHSSPILLHYITPSSLSPVASLTLDSSKHRKSAVYGITRPPPSSPLGSSDQVIVSGWYDGGVRVHDLRACERGVSSGNGTGSALLPALELRDPWTPEPVYCVSCGGGSASFIAAGTARHSVVAFWDIRHPAKGWSVYAPGNDPSPIYSIILESSRLFGATQSRPFVYDFGPGVTKDTYPPISPTRGRADQRLKPTGDGINFHVLKYNHEHERTDILSPNQL